MKEEYSHPVSPPSVVRPTSPPLKVVLERKGVEKAIVLRGVPLRPDAKNRWDYPLIEFLKLIPTGWRVHDVFPLQKKWWGDWNRSIKG